MGTSVVKVVVIVSTETNVSSLYRTCRVVDGDRGYVEFPMSLAVLGEKGGGVALALGLLRNCQCDRYVVWRGDSYGMPTGRKAEGPTAPDEDGKGNGAPV